MSKKEEIYKDARFAHLLKNPRFKTIPKKETKVKIDERFKSMFENDKFNIQYNVDKYGRKVNKKSAENLKNYYELGSSESSGGEEEEEEKDENVEGNAIIKGGNKMPEKLKDKLKDMEVDYLRGEGILQSDSSDEESSDDDDEDAAVEHNWGELDADAERTEDSSKRIACMHMDWDRIRAVDIMVLCNSFIPAGAGSIISVKIYPSEFGKQRMAEEEIKGPKEITTQAADDNPVDEEDEAYVEKLREYQLNRLKYYYAVVEFDSIKCADIVYKECDGLEYESTSNRLDLRFIPDDLEFDDDPKDSCSELPDFSKYEPRIFFTTALQHAKVELTWDETDISRKEISEKLFTEKGMKLNDRDLRNYVAFSSESEHESEPNESEDDEAVQTTGKRNKIDLYKSLLDDINRKEDEKKKRQVEMEYSWGVGGSKKKESAEDESDEEQLTPFEQILEKKKQKNKSKKEVRAKKLRNDDDEEEDENEYSSSDMDDIDMNDPFFAEEFANDEYKKPKMKKNSKKKSEKLKNDSEDDEKMKAQNALELLLHDDDDEKSHFSLKKIQESEDMSSKKKKRKLKQLKKKGIETAEGEDNFKINIQDERFSAVFSQPEFNIDPTNPGFKKTKGMEKIIEEKLKRRHENDDSEPILEDKKKQKIKDTSLNMLVKNIKRKVGK